MLEYDWLLTAFIYGLIGCFTSRLSDLTHLIISYLNRHIRISTGGLQTGVCDANCSLRDLNFAEI